MTVAELIKELQECPQNAEVLLMLDDGTECEILGTNPGADNAGQPDPIFLDWSEI